MSTPSLWPAGLTIALGAVGGYLVARSLGARRAELAERAAYRRGLQDGHNRLAHRHERKMRKAREVAPRWSRATLPDGL